MKLPKAVFELEFGHVKPIRFQQSVALCLALHELRFPHCPVASPFSTSMIPGRSRFIFSFLALLLQTTDPCAPHATDEIVLSNLIGITEQQRMANCLLRPASPLQKCSPPQSCLIDLICLCIELLEVQCCSEL